MSVDSVRRTCDASLPEGGGFAASETPCYVVDARALERNLAVLRGVADATGCRILLAQKPFPMFRLYPLIGRYLSGAASSGLYEARLAREAMGEAREVHVYAPAFKDDEFDRLLGVVDVIVFNTFEQWERFRDRVRAHNASGGRPISCGLRVNPGYSEVDVPLYDPARPDSRLGVGANAFRRASRRAVSTAWTGCIFIRCASRARRARSDDRAHGRDVRPVLAAPPMDQSRRRPSHHARRLRSRFIACDHPTR
jgi:diaminopimelate decarboxylase